MAKLSVVIQWNGEPVTCNFSKTFTPDEIRLFVTKIMHDGFVRIASPADLVEDTDVSRMIYIIPVHNILRFPVELEPGEECPEPHY